MPENDVHAALTAIDGTWRKTEMAPVFVNELDDGKYQGEIQNPGLQVSKTSKRLQIAWPMMVVSGAKKNSKITKFEGITTKQNMSYVKQTLSKLGLPEASSAFALQDIVPKANGLVVEFTVKNKDGYCNIFFNKVIKPGDAVPTRKMM